MPSSSTIFFSKTADLNAQFKANKVSIKHFVVGFRRSTVDSNRTIYQSKNVLFFFFLFCCQKAKMLKATTETDVIKFGQEIDILPVGSFREQTDLHFNILAVWFYSNTAYNSLENPAGRAPHVRSSLVFKEDKHYKSPRSPICHPM